MERQDLGSKRLYSSRDAAGEDGNHEAFPEGTAARAGHQGAKPP
jgi:hypothetical protein